jgi:hypothetical protein
MDLPNGELERLIMDYPKGKAIENLRNTTEYMQHVLFGLCLAHDVEAIKINSIEKIHLTLGSCIVDLTEFGREFIKDRTNQKRLDSTLLKLLVSGVSLACNIAQKYYERWQPPYPFAYQIRNMYSHGLFWKFNPGWISEYKENEGEFPIIYKNLKIEESFNGRKARIGDVNPCGDLVQLVEDIIFEISNW